MVNEGGRERDIILGPGDYSYVQDTTKGEVNMYVGPVKISMSNTERLVEFADGKFVPIRYQAGQTGIETFVTADSSEYAVLENPTSDEKASYTRGPNSSVELDNGKKVVVAGPFSVPLWPGQKATVIPGHTLSEDEYVIIRAYESASIEIGDDKREDVPIGTEFYVTGSDVSFFVPPSGFEVVPESGNTYVRKAHHLKSERGLHLKVTKDFSVEDGSDLAEYITPGAYKIGQELFLSGLEGIFFPSETLDVIGEVNPIPLAGDEGIYVMDKVTGAIRTKKGPEHFLPNPINEEVISRNLDQRVRDIYKTVNAEGRAISIYVPPNNAVMVISENKRDVIKGPGTHILDYTDNLEELALSTGTPKTDTTLLKTAYLQIEGNKVSDEVKVETKDHVRLNLRVSYRLNFEEEPSKWFDVNNYVRLLCDHLSSILRSAVSQASLDEFYSDSTELLRNSILGAKKEKEERKGRKFTENNMRVYDLEVLNISILDNQIEEMLTEAQKDAFTNEMRKRSSERELEVSIVTEKCQQEMYGLKQVTLEKKVELQRLEAEMALQAIQDTVLQDREKKLGLMDNAIGAEKIKYEHDKQQDEDKQQRELDFLKAETTEYSQRMEAITPDLIAVMNRLGDQELLTGLAEHLGQLSVLEGKSIQEILQTALKTLPYTGKAMEALKIRDE